MTIHIQIEDRQQYLYVHCQGEFELQAFLTVLETAFKGAVDQDRTAVLVDIRNVGRNIPTTMERFEIGSQAARLQQSQYLHIRMAIVGNEPFIDKDRFGETVARNRGAMGKVFTDLDQAIAWVTI